MTSPRNASRSMAVFGTVVIGILSSLAILHVACSSPANFPSNGTVPATTQAIVDPPRNLSPLREGVWTYLVTDGDGKGTTITQKVWRDSTDTISPWRRAFSASNVIAHLRQEADGSIIMPANEILDHDVANTFDPPQIVLPAPELLETPIHLTSRVTTRLRGGPKLQVDHGTAELSLVPVGVEKLTTPAGAFECRIIQLKLHLKFGLGDVQSIARLDYADNVGLVAEDYEEQATSFFLKSQKKRKTVLKSYPLR